LNSFGVSVTHSRFGVIRNLSAWMQKYPMDRKAELAG
jgi:hypothetical protein